MAAFDPATLDRWRALAIVDRDGTTVGTISEFYLDRETGHPTWALVETGLFGATQTFVPLVHATEIEDGLQVPYEKRHMKDSPRVDPHDELTPDEEARLFAHYGVDYEPAPPGEGSEAPEAPGPVPADASTAEEVEADPDEPGTAEEPGPVPAEPGTVEGPGPVPAEPGTVEGPEPVPGEPGTTEGPEPVPGEPATPEGPGPVAEEPGTTERPEAATGAAAAAAAPSTVEMWEADPAEPGSVGPHDSIPMDPIPVEGAVELGTVSGEPRTREGPGRVPPEAGPGGPDDATLIAPGGFGPSEHPADAPDPNLSRTAAVGPGLPGSTAASPGPVPTTVDKDTDDPLRDQDEPQWTPAPAGSFGEPHPVDRPARASDRWREAKLAAERERIARAAAAQPEERSPLERARRRLERLVGVGQDQSDDSPTDREAAERARRARLGFDEDDPRFR